MNPLRPAILVAVPLASAAFLAAPAQAAAVTERDVYHHQTFVVHDVNICDDLATFTFDVSGHVITTDTGDGFHFRFQENDRYTVDFDDPAVGTWSARATETGVFNATPGGAVTLHIGNNNIEGDVKIRELLTFVVDPGGRVRVDRATLEVVGC